MPRRCRPTETATHHNASATSSAASSPPRPVAGGSARFDEVVVPRAGVSAFARWWRDSCGLAQVWSVQVSGSGRAPALGGDVRGRGHRLSASLLRRNEVACEAAESPPGTDDVRRKSELASRIAVERVRLTRDYLFQACLVESCQR